MKETAKEAKHERSIPFDEYDQLLTRMENLLYACEAKAQMPSTAYLKGINAQIERDLNFVKAQQAKYPRNPGKKGTTR